MNTFFRVTFEKTEVIEKAEKLKISSQFEVCIYKPPFVDLPFQMIEGQGKAEFSLFLIKNDQVFSQALIDFNGCVMEFEANLVGSEENNVIGKVKGKFAREKTEIEGEVFQFSEENFNDLVNSLNQKKITKRISQKKLFGINTERILTIDANSSKCQNIKSLLVGINEKLKVLELLKEKCEDLEEKLRIERQDKEKLAEKNLQNFEEFRGKIENFEEIMRKKSEFSQKNIEEIHDLRGKLLKVSGEKEVLQVEFDCLKAEFLKEKGEKRLHSSMENLINELQTSIKIKEDSANSLKSEMGKIESGHFFNLSQQQEFIDKLLEENADFKEKYAALDEKYGKLLGKYEEISSLCKDLEAENASGHARLQCIEELEARCSQLEVSSQKDKADHASLQDLLEKSNKRLKDCIIEYQKERINLNKLNKQLATEKFVSEKESAILQQNLSKVQAELIKFQALKFADRDYKKYIDEHKKHAESLKFIIETYQKFEKDLSSQIDSSAEKIILLSEKQLNSKRALERLLKICQEKIEEIPKLKEIISELEKGRDLYIAVPGDLIDNYLANYINSRKEALEVPFVRLHNGMYMYGTKKVAIRIENSGIVSNF